MTDAPEDLQFEQAEFDEPAELPTTCAACGGSLGEAFWVEDGRFALCGSCTKERATPEGYSVMGFVLALGLGFIGAVLAGGVWGVIGGVTGYNIGLIAIAAGAVVAIAVRMGAGRGGVPFQGIAAALTYLAICVNEAVSFAWMEVADGAATWMDAALMVLLGTPIVLVGLIPGTLEGGGFISLLIYGFALWQAIQMTAAAPRVHEGPFPTDA